MAGLRRRPDHVSHHRRRRARSVPSRLSVVRVDRDGAGDRTGVLRLQDRAAEGAVGHRRAGSHRAAERRGAPARERRRRNGDRLRASEAAHLGRPRRRSQRVRDGTRAQRFPRRGDPRPPRAVQPRRAAGGRRPRNGPREEPGRPSHDDHRGARRRDPPDPRRRGPLDALQRGSPRRRRQPPRRQGREPARRHPAGHLDPVVDRGAVHHAAARARRQPAPGVSRRRDERAVHAQPACPGERAGEDRARGGADDGDQARRGPPVHRRSPRPPADAAGGLAGRPAGYASADGHAHRAAQGHGLRGAQGGGRAEGVRGWLRRRALRTIHQFRTRLARYKLQERRLARVALADDAAITAAIQAHMAEHQLPEAAVRRRVRQYLDEIVPNFSVLSYYKLGYNLAKVFVNLLYKVSVDYQDETALGRIPKQDVVVYLMNHRSNADYVVVAYVLARGVHVSYAVGEWARAWPLEYVFKSFGAYFIRRRFREPLYHTVLERYVQLITRNRVTQGIFPEGGLSRDGKLRPPKLGLLDYICRTLTDPAFDRDIWFVPVALNYDRVLEDRSLIRELIDQEDRPSRLAQLGTVLSYLASNTA